MTKLTLEAANSIINRAYSTANGKGLKPLSIAVLDAGGHLIAFQKQDGASMLRFELAFGKAYGALAVGFGSRWLDKASADRPHFVSGLTAISGGKRDQAGRLLGAVGITGDTSDNDEAVAVEAIEFGDWNAQAA